MLDKAGKFLRGFGERGRGLAPPLALPPHNLQPCIPSVEAAAVPWGPSGASGVVMLTIGARVSPPAGEGGVKNMHGMHMQVHRPGRLRWPRRTRS